MDLDTHVKPECDRKPVVSVGCQWIVDAAGCDPIKLQSLETVERVCRSVVDSLGLHVIGQPQSHRFGPPHGVTSLFLLSESHLACHTYPEHALATFNLVCCRESAEWPWESELAHQLSAKHVRVRSLPRGDWS